MQSFGILRIWYVSLLLWFDLFLFVCLYGNLVYIPVKSISFPGKPLEGHRGGIHKADFVPMFTQLMLMCFFVWMLTLQELRVRCQQWRQLVVQQRFLSFFCLTFFRCAWCRTWVRSNFNYFQLSVQRQQYHLKLCLIFFTASWIIYKWTAYMYLSILHLIYLNVYIIPIPCPFFYHSSIPYMIKFHGLTTVTEKAMESSEEFVFKK